jgi:hypothetical protein
MRKLGQHERCSFFPQLLPGEALLSACARYKDRLGVENDRQTTRDLFHAKNVTVSLTLPTNLKVFIQTLPKGHGYTEEHIIANHTLFPYYAFGLSDTRAKKLHADMMGSNGKAIHLSTGITASPIPKPRYARFCPTCLKEDIENYGETYWHISHQIPGICVCPKHAVWLEDSTFPIRGQSAKYKLEPPRKVAIFLNPSPLNLAKSIDRHRLWLAKEAMSTMELTPLRSEPIKLRKHYLHLLHQKGLALSNGRLKIQKILDAFNNFYPQNFLKELGCEIQANTKESWLLRNLRLSEERISPIQHLLVIHFLGWDVKSISANPIIKLDMPFGSGPWHCLNQVCLYHLQKTIQAVTIHHKEGFPVGVFSCPKCGYTYSRRGPDRSSEDKYRKPRIIDYGHQWREKIIKLSADSKISLRAKARELGVDPKTVLRHQNLKSSGHGLEGSHKSKKTKEIKSRRTLWLALVKQHPGLGVAELRKLSPSTYSWLYRNDRSWLMTQRPKSPNRSLGRYKRVDWAARDETLSNQIRGAVENITSRPGKAVQVTRSSIGREMGALHLFQKEINKLPLTRQILCEVVEDRVAYALRRIERVLNEHKVSGETLPRWLFVRKAGIERVEKFPEIKSALSRI